MPARILAKGINNTMLKKTIFLFLSFNLLLAACASRDVEMPTNDAPGSDEMRISPCVCQPIEFKPEGYQWLG